MRHLLSIVFACVIAASALLTFSPPAAAQSNCPEPHLAVGGQGRVTPGSSNRIRDAASTSGSQVGQIPAGGVFDVLEGPQCVDGFLWWRVSYQGVEGWTVEGNASGYFVEPFDSNAATATLAPAGEAQACPAGSVPEPQLVVGMQGRVVGRTPSRVRNAPSASGDQIAQIDPIDVFVVLAGPVCADGYNWWQIDLNGTQGWTAEGQGKDYFVEPIAATATPTATRTPLPTFTPTFTRTPGPTLTPSMTFTPSITPTATPVPIDSPTHVTWSSDSQWLAVSTAHEVLLYSVDSLDVPLRVLNIAGNIDDILFSPTVPKALAVADDHSVYLYDVEANQMIQQLGDSGSQFSLSFSADGSLLGATDGSGVYIYTVESGQSNKPSSAAWGPQIAAVLSPDGENIAVIADEPNMGIYPVKGSADFFLRRGSNGDVLNAVAFSPDSTKVVVGDRRGDVEMWDITHTRDEKNFIDRLAFFIRAEDDPSQSHLVNALTFSPDGLVIASAESDPQGIIRIFRSDNLQQIHTFGVNTGDTLTTDVAFSPDGKYLAYSADRSVRILETESYTQVATLIRSH